MWKRAILAGGILLLLVLTIPATTVFAQSAKVPVVILFKDKVTDKHENLVKSSGGEIKHTYKIINGLAANLSEKEVDNLKKNPLVASVDPDVEVRALDINADNQIRASDVWSAGYTGTGVKVAILDTGIDTTHPEFNSRIVNCHNEIYKVKTTCLDENGHGTHVAGIVGASGVYPSAKGVAPSALFVIDQVLNAQGSGSLSGIIAGIDYSVASGAKVISMSLGTSPITKNSPNCDSTYPSFTAAITNAVNAGVTVVAAAGNSGQQGVGAPACISKTIAVAAVSSTDSIASFSSVGAPVKDHGIAAPGVSIFSTWKSGAYNTISGTSMATPHVSGTIALMLQAKPSLTPTEIKNTLFNTACTSTTDPSCPTGAVPNNSYGYGRVDALRAVNAVLAPVSPPPTTIHDVAVTDVTAPSSVVQGNTVTVGVTVKNEGTESESFTASLADTTDNTSIGSQSVTLAAGGSQTIQFSWSTSSASVALHTLTATASTVTGETDTADNTKTASVTVTSSSTTATTVSITAVDYNTSGGKNADRQLNIKLTLKDNLQNPVSGASVSIQLYRNGSPVATGTGTTTTDGTVTFVLKNASPGTYSTTATSVSASGLSWDGYTPPNSFTKTSSTQGNK
jgi:subtilisin family serine protease